MGRERLGSPSFAKFFFALTSHKKEINGPVEAVLEEEFGALDTHSEVYSFSEFSDYYEEELGGSCWKYLVALRELRPVDQLVPVKLTVERIEEKLSHYVEGHRKRTVNIDPGFLTGWQVVLSSVKNHGHRLYISDGVYCELTLLFRKGKFQSLPWTYRDYLTPSVLAFLKDLRSDYSKRIKELE